MLLPERAARLVAVMLPVIELADSRTNVEDVGIIPDALISPLSELPMRSVPAVSFAEFSTV